MIHLLLGPRSPIWRHVSASFKTENFKWISYITRKSTRNNEQIHYSVSRSKTSQPAKRTHARTHSLSLSHMHASVSTVWKSPYYHQYMRNHSAFQMFDMNYLSTLNKLSFLLSGAVNHPHSGPRGPSKEIIFTRCDKRCRVLNSLRTVGENKRNSMRFIT